MSFLITIDPGSYGHGAWAEWEDGELVTVHRYGKDGYKGSLTAEQKQDLRVVREDVPPGSGNMTGYTAGIFGESIGYWNGWVMAQELGDCYELVRPEVWQKPWRNKLPAGADKYSYNQRKAILWEIAQELYPGVKILKPCADAVLIGHWALGKGAVV